MADLSAYEKNVACQDQETVIKNLKEQLAERETRLREGEDLRKKLHNTILVLENFPPLSFQMLVWANFS